MTPVKQTEFTDGTMSDCLRAAIASLLNQQLAVTPHFLVLGLTLRSNWLKVLRDWLNTNDLEYKILYKPPAGYSVAIGPVGKSYHAVVVRNGKLVHDPNGGPGLDAAHTWIVITPIDYEQRAIETRRYNRNRFGYCG